MAKQDDISTPQTAQEAVARAAKHVLEAAKDLCLAADLADEGDQVDYLINGAIRLRDIANSMAPDRPDWPTDGAAIYDIRTKQRVN